MNAKVPLHRLVLREIERIRLYETLLLDYREVSRNDENTNVAKKMTCTVNLLVSEAFYMPHPHPVPLILAP